MNYLKTKNFLSRLSVALVILLLSTLSVLAQDNNILIGLNAPAYGVKIKANFPGYNGGWARAFTLTNHNNTETHIQLGALGSVIDGVDGLRYGYIGKRYNDTYMVFKPNGNIGIGTVNPTHKLSVNGNIHTKEVRVQTGWSDYVFYDDYQLPTLEEEEQHIEQKGHLLGFESEEDMQGEVLLGDVSKRQQAKIEEMMLHLIQINKQLQTVEAKVIDLEQENTQLKKQLASKK